jgi:hypothetical protein
MREAVDSMEIDRRRGWTRGAGETDRENGKGKIPKKFEKFNEFFSTQQLDNSEKKKQRHATHERVCDRRVVVGWWIFYFAGTAKRKEVKVPHLFCL